jgi:hypothetical protein
MREGSSRRLEHSLARPCRTTGCRRDAQTRLRTESGRLQEDRINAPRGRRAAAIALAYDVALGHHEEPQLASHLLASVPLGLYVECFHPDRDQIWWNLVANRPQLRDGWLELPHGPGLGWELDLDYVERHRVST